MCVTLLVQSDSTSTLLNSTCEETDTTSSPPPMFSHPVPRDIGGKEWGRGTGTGTGVDLQYLSGVDLEM